MILIDSSVWIAFFTDGKGSAVARTAIENDLYLLHQDSDFERIALAFPLKIYPTTI